MTTAAAPATGQPRWLHRPVDPNALLGPLWSRNVSRDPTGQLQVAGISATQLAAEHGTPTFVVDEQDFRARARTFRDALPDGTVFYAGKAFLCVAVARWVVEEGLHLDVCSGGELQVAMRAGVPPAGIAFHGNNKSGAELDLALSTGVGRIVVDSRDEIDRLSELARRRGVVASVLLRVTPGVAAQTHAHVATAHEDQKFGFSIAAGDAETAARQVIGEPGLRLLGLHCHLGSQIFATEAFGLAARRVLAVHRALADRGHWCPELGLGGGFGIAYTSRDTPLSADHLGPTLRAIVHAACAELGVRVPRLSIEPGRAIAGPAAFTLYEVGTVKRVPLEGGGARTYVAVDGGMSDNIRAALYAADYSCTLASRRSDALPVLARVVGKHCESGDVVVRDEFLPGDVAPGDLVAVPGTGAYCRSLASNYNHVPRPPVVAVRAGDHRVIVRRETDDDLLRLDVG